MSRGMSSEASRWFDEALWDEETARILHREKRYNAAAFYAYQAAEKAVKALLYNVHEAAWGHSVRELIQRYFTKTGKSQDERILTLARELDRHYIPARYPNAFPSGTPHEAYDEEISRRAIEACGEIIRFVRREFEQSRD